MLNTLPQYSISAMIKNEHDAAGIVPGNRVANTIVDAARGVSILKTSPEMGFSCAKAGSNSAVMRIARETATLPNFCESLAVHAFRRRWGQMRGPAQPKARMPPVRANGTPVKSSRRQWNGQSPHRLEIPAQALRQPHDDRKSSVALKKLAGLPPTERNGDGILHVGQIEAQPGQFQAVEVDAQ